MNGLLHAEAEISARSDRVVWLSRRHYIDAANENAADLLIDDCETAERVLYGSVGAGTSAGRGRPPETRIAAQARLEAAREALGPRLSEILSLVVIHNMTLGEAARSMKIHEKAALPLVQAAFEVLTGHYARKGLAR